MPSEYIEKKHAGYVEWNPQYKTLKIMDQVSQVLDQYRDYWPLTIRQIFYRLVADHGYSKTEQAYGRLINYLGRARRAEMIPFAAIRDDGARSFGLEGHNGVEDWSNEVISSADQFIFNRMNFQPERVEVFCEAAGMLGMLANAVTPYGVNTYSGGGFNSLTTVRQTAERIVSDDRDCIILNFGDLDPSGESIFESFRQDVEAFCYQLAGCCQVSFRRVALTQEQVDERGYETAPPKSTDSRSIKWVGDTAQLEAIPPDELTQMAADSVMNILDMDIHADVIEWEGKIRKRLLKEANSMAKSIGNYDGS